MLFPYPRIAHRFFSRNGHEWWGYVTGEWGGGAWAFKDAAGGHEWVEYDDYRLLFGVEWLNSHGSTGHIEAGYVFHREMRFLDAMPNFNPSDGFLLRIGIVH